MSLTDQRTVKFCAFTATLVSFELTLASFWKALDPGFFMFGLRGVFGTEFYPSYFSVGVLIFIEFSLALWLASGWQRKKAFILSAFLFIIFTSYHIFAYYHGYRHSCSCFGKLWEYLQIIPHGIVDFSMALIPVIFLISAIALIESKKILLENKTNKFWPIFIVLFASLSFFFFYSNVQNRSLYGIQSLWGSYEKIDVHDHFFKKITLSIQNDITRKNLEIFNPNQLISLSAKIIEAHAFDDFQKYTQIFKEKNYQINFELINDIKKSYFTYPENAPKNWEHLNNDQIIENQFKDIFSWQEVAYNRITVKKLRSNGKDLFDLSDNFGLDMGDLVQTNRYLPFIIKSKTLEQATEIVAISIPIKRNRQRNLFVYLFSKNNSKNWIYQMLITLKSLDSDYLE